LKHFVLNTRRFKNPCITDNKAYKLRRSKITLRTYKLNLFLKLIILIITKNKLISFQNLFIQIILPKWKNSAELIILSQNIKWFFKRIST